jgi:hypothetical protein
MKRYKVFWSSFCIFFISVVQVQEYKNVKESSSEYTWWNIFYQRADILVIFLI